MLKISNLNINGFCIGRYGHFYMREDKIKCSFKKGINFILGNLQDIGWGITESICRGKNVNVNKEFLPDIQYENNNITLKDLNSLSYYVMNEKYVMRKNSFFHRDNKSVYQRFVKNCKSQSEIDNIINLFELEEIFYKRKLSFLGVRRLRYSISLGFSQRKKIFCTCWKPKNEIEIYLYHFNFYSQIAEKYNLIFIFPVEPTIDLSNADFDYNIVKIEK